KNVSKLTTPPPGSSPWLSRIAAGGRSGASATWTWRISPAMSLISRPVPSAWCQCHDPPSSPTPGPQEDTKSAPPLTVPVNPGGGWVERAWQRRRARAQPGQRRRAGGPVGRGFDGVRQDHVERSEARVARYLERGVPSNLGLARQRGVV